MPFILTKSKIITCKQVPKPWLSAFKELLTRTCRWSLRPPDDHQVASTSHTESMSETIRQSKTRYSTKHASPALRKSSKFAHAANLFVNSTDSSEEEIKANFEPLVTPNRPVASVEGNDDKKGKKMKRKKSDHRGKLAKQASKAHEEMCSKAMQMIDKIQGFRWHRLTLIYRASANSNVETICAHCSGINKETNCNFSCAALFYW